jgi:hypothetical protein
LAGELFIINQYFCDRIAYLPSYGGKRASFNSVRGIDATPIKGCKIKTPLSFLHPYCQSQHNKFQKNLSPQNKEEGIAALWLFNSFLLWETRRQGDKETRRNLNSQLPTPNS